MPGPKIDVIIIDEVCNIDKLRGSPIGDLHLSGDGLLLLNKSGTFI